MTNDTKPVYVQLDNKKLYGMRSQEVVTPEHEEIVKYVSESKWTITWIFYSFNRHKIHLIDQAERKTLLWGFIKGKKRIKRGLKIFLSKNVPKVTYIVVFSVIFFF